MLQNLSFSQTLIQQVDKLVLYSMNRRVPTSLETSYDAAKTFESVLAETQIDRRKTAVYHLTAPGEHTIWLDTPQGDIRCHVRVRLALDPAAPLLIYHHGLNELPYTNSWRRLFPAKESFPFHSVVVQAPYHDNWMDPLDKGFASLNSIYQLFAGSLRIMEAVQNQFEAFGAAYTVLAGVSWGGITSLLYEGMFQRTQAVIPMLSSPNLAQTMQGIADLFDRPINIPQAALTDALDFTPYYDECDDAHVFPLLGENDQFFPFEQHAPLFDKRPLTTVPGGHITAMWQSGPLREHILQVMAQYAP